MDTFLSLLRDLTLLIPISQLAGQAQPPYEHKVKMNQNIKEGGVSA